MPITRKRKGRARTTRRPPQRRRIMRVRKPLALKMHNFVERTLPYQLTVAQESSATGYFRQFTWAQCLQVGNYANIFEYYRINKAVVEFRYKGGCFNPCLYYRTSIIRWNSSIICNGNQE
jgi:hypothetical protein